MSDQPQVVITDSSVVKLPRGVRLRKDPVRDHMVLLAPERAMALDDIAVVIVQALDGVKSVDVLSQEFSEKFNAPKDQIAQDIKAFLTELSNRRMLEIVQ